MQILIKSKLAPKFFKKGGSIAVNGVCLTVEKYFRGKGEFQVTLIQETLSKSNFLDFGAGDFLNLEAPLTLETPISGHLVSGHVDATGKVIKTGADLQIKIPANLIKYFPVKSSVCINGVSLTVAANKFGIIVIALIPETLKSTNLSNLKVNDNVNLEIDLIARYLESLKNA